MRVRGVLVVLLLFPLSAGCASAPAGTYFPPPADATARRFAQTLHRAVFAAGDDPARYGFAFVQSPVIAAYSDEEGTVYVTDALMRQPDPIVDAVIAHEVAHEVLGHIGSRRRLSLALSAGFGAVGIVAPGAGLFDLLVNPLAVRSFSRRQELEADQKAVEILRTMGYGRPRRTLAEALRTVDGVGPRPKEHLGGLFSTHPALEDRLSALEPLEPPTSPIARKRPAP